MRLRGVTAAAAGACAAATGHALDAAGTLPFVHEAASVRMAMSPLLTAAWLALAAGLSAFAARTRPVLVGAPAALVVSAAPELAGRGDPGALFEPGAMLGAVLQLLLVVAVVALAVVLQRRLGLLFVAELGLPGCGHELRSFRALVGLGVDRTGEPRAPPVVRMSTT